MLLRSFIIIVVLALISETKSEPGAVATGFQTEAKRKGSEHSSYSSAWDPVATAPGSDFPLILAQEGDNLPKEVQGYKVQRARVELKKTDASKKEKDGKKEKEDQEIDEVLIRLGEPKLVGVSPLGITFDLPVILAAIKQQGDIDRLVFEDIRVNETPVTIEDYVQPFKLPNKEALTLEPPLRVFVSTPHAVLTTIDDVFNSKETWPVTGRIYVLGNYKKFLFKFKRAVPVELQSTIKNPLR